ncbi:MAG TPA: ROK family protein [Verrucomicrobiae bacterium]|nr:ROK family protein [Verrucomicrobiae bacterium]
MATSSHLRRINERKIIQTMLRLRNASRTKLAEVAGMSQATVGRIVDDMIAQSVIAEVAMDEDSVPAAGRPLGRPIKVLELDRKRRRFLLVQLGVRQTRLAAMPVAAPEVDKWPVEFATPSSAEKWIKSLRRNCNRLPLSNIEAVVMSCPGVVDERSGKVLLSPNMRWSEKIDFPAALRTVVEKPAIFVQEIRALALGQLSAEPHLEDFLLVDFGDGVGAATVVGSQLQSGHIPLSGELGHTPVLNNSRRCGCGAIGCIETLVSSVGLLKSFDEHSGQRGWKTLIGHVKHHGLPHWLKASLDAVATTVAGALNVEGIASVLLTGTLTEFPEIVKEYLSAEIRRGAMWNRLGTVTCRTAPRRRMAGMISAGIDRALFANDE